MASVVSLCRGSGEWVIPSHPGGWTDDDLRVPDGRSLAVTTSALIKSLRRGREAEALYFAAQMERKFWRYVWRRLAIFAAEGVGLADLDAIVRVQALAAAYADARQHSRRPPDGNLLALAVLLLARSPKNREADGLKNCVDGLTKAGWRPEVPDEALDGHTPEGRERFDPEAREVHWLTVGSVVVPDVGPKDWTLRAMRSTARKGLIRSDRVEEQARQWNAEGRLRWGVDGYEIDNGKEQ